jgi:TonB family protein
MKCLWPPTPTITGKVLAQLALLVVLGGVVWCVAPITQRVGVLRGRFTQREQNLRRTPVHISEFAPLSKPMALPGCGDFRPPEALLTPDPTWQLPDHALPVRVSFIVGSDGQVHSPFILDSGGPEEDQLILRAVRHWRYRPALCNGVPTDFEASVRFALP